MAKRKRKKPQVWVWMFVELELLTEPDEEGETCRHVLVERRLKNLVEPPPVGSELSVRGYDQGPDPSVIELRYLEGENLWQVHLEDVKFKASEKALYESLLLTLLANGWESDEIVHELKKHMR